MPLEIIPVKIISVVQQNINFFGNIIHELSMAENEKLHLRYNKSYNVIKYECWIYVIRIKIKIIGYKLFMKPAPQPHITYVMILHIFGIDYVLRHYICFQIFQNSWQQKYTEGCRVLRL